MSLLGTLEQLSLSSVLQRIEMHAKTGLIVVKQGGQWVELYFREGCLLCIGPVRTDATLGERLLQAGIISSQALQDALQVIGAAQRSETRIALTLIDLGYVGREKLRIWATQRATEVLQLLFSWQRGEIYFEENVAPSPDRLQVALSVTSLLSASAVTSSPPGLVYAETSHHTGNGFTSASPSPTASAPARLVPVSFLPDALSSSTPYISAASLLPAFDSAVNTGPVIPFQTPRPHSVSEVAPVTPRCIDISFMRPEMILIPADLSSMRENSTVVQLTPEQWRLLTRVDGSTSLQTAAQALGMNPEIVYQVVGELIAQGLILVVPPIPLSQVDELSPVSRELVASGLGNGYVAPGYGAASASPWGATLPTSDVLPQFSPTIACETQSQWGNGGNGATFVPGRGWIASPQPLQPLQSDSSPGSSVSHKLYASVGGL